jgi:hypothetical protein
METMTKSERMNLYDAHTEICNINASSLTLTKEHLDDFLKNCKDKKIQEIRDLVKMAEKCLELATEKLDDVIELIA